MEFISNNSIEEIPFDYNNIIREIFSNGSFKNDNVELKEWESVRENVSGIEDTVFVGTLKFGDNNIYQGLLDFNLKKDLIGLQKYNNGNFYFGEWKNNKRNGSGIFLHNIQSDKRNKFEIYLGKWNNNEPDSEGVFVCIEEPEKNEDFMETEFNAFVGEMNFRKYKRGINFQKNAKKFYAFYGSFNENNQKSDDGAYFYDNDFTNDRVFKGKIKNDEILDGFLCCYHQEEIKDTCYLKFNGGVPIEVLPKQLFDEDTLIKANEDTKKFRECLYEEDWFGVIYEKIKETVRIIKTLKVENFDNEDKFNELLKIINCYKEINVYSILCSKTA